jgi:hypothetical protein
VKKAAEKFMKKYHENFMKASGRISHSLDTVQLLVGHSHLDHVSPYLEVSARERCEAMAAFDDNRD